MKKLIVAALSILPLLALTAPVRANGGLSITYAGCPYHVEGGFNAHFRVQDGGAQAGPWYLYWPLEAHFQHPAPTGFPFWPSPMSLPPDPHARAAYPSFVPSAPAPVAAPAVYPASLRPVGYQTVSPSYWYQK